MEMGDNEKYNQIIIIKAMKKKIQKRPLSLFVIIADIQLFNSNCFKLFNEVTAYQTQIITKNTLLEKIFSLQYVICNTEQ